MINPDEIYIMPVKIGDQGPVVEHGLSIVGQPPGNLVWVTNKNTVPVFVLLPGNKGGQYMLPVWTRIKKKLTPEEK